MQTTKTALMIELTIGLALALGCSHAKTQTDQNLAGRTQLSASPRQKATAPSKTSAEDTTSNQGANEHAVYFQLDSAQIAERDRLTLQAIARDAKGSHIRIEGNCDERGTTEYNLTLGDRRAQSAAKYLEQLGVPATRIDYVSYGSERPKDSGHDDSAWAKNRRDDIFVR
jgi:peptidoglycan-associated lipoprotein